MSTKKSVRRKALGDRTNFILSDQSPKPKSEPKPKRPKPDPKPTASFTNSLSSIGSNEGQQQPIQPPNPSHSSTPQPNRTRCLDEDDLWKLDISKTYTRSGTGAKLNKKKAIEFASCPPAGRGRTIGAKLKGPSENVANSEPRKNKEKKLFHKKPISTDEDSSLKAFIENAKGFFDELDKEKLEVVEVASESELE